MPNTITVCISASDQGPVLLSHFEVVENMEKYRLERLDQRGQSLWHVTRLRHSSDSTFRVRSISIVCTVMRCTRSLTPQHRARISVQLTTNLPPTRRRRRLLPTARFIESFSGELLTQNKHRNIRSEPPTKKRDLSLKEILRTLSHDIVITYRNVLSITHQLEQYVANSNRKRR